jgi:hypothetical protein
VAVEMLQQVAEEEQMLEVKQHLALLNLAQVEQENNG